MRGKLITIEGIDGSGKGTQAKRLLEALGQKGMAARLFSFPNYGNTFFAKEVGRFLDGQLGSLEAVHPKLAAMLFAGDRFEMKGELEACLQQGCHVICDRFTASNIAHQSVKLGSEGFEPFAAWLEELEHGVYGLPWPDFTVFLDVPLDQTRKLVLLKEKRSYTEQKEDIQEQDKDYQGRVYDAYQALYKRGGWYRLACLGADGLRSIEDISEELITRVSEFLEGA